MKILFGLLTCLIATVYSQTCSLTNVVSSAGQFTYEEQGTAAFCRELVVGPVNSINTILVNLLQIKVACELGQKVQMYTPERHLVYDYCNQRSLTYIKADNKYLILRLVAPSAYLISVTFNLYLIVPTTSIVTNNTTNPTTFLTTTSTSTITATTTTTSVNALSCGLPTIKPNEQLLRIVGGIEAIPNSWPWQAFLTNGNFLCGASLVDNQWLVTAAHCIYGMQTGTLKVYLGLHTLNTMEPTTVMRMITKIVQHPSYNPQNLDNDIALLKINTINYTNTISPICLPKQGDNLAQPGKTGFVTGWGKISGYGSTSDKLRQVNINVIQCSFGNSQNMICAGQQAPSVVHDSCQGDSGGPFMIKSNGNYFLSGIVSWGGAECLGDGVYTKVSNFIDWINNVKRTN